MIIITINIVYATHMFCIYYILCRGGGGGGGGREGERLSDVIIKDAIIERAK